MEGERELRGTWFRQERSSVVVDGPRVERCRVTDPSRHGRVPFSGAFTWIKRAASARYAATRLRLCVLLNLVSIPGGGHASAPQRTFRPFLRATIKRKIESKAKPRRDWSPPQARTPCRGCACPETRVICPLRTCLLCLPPTVPLFLGRTPRVTVSVGCRGSAARA